MKLAIITLNYNGKQDTLDFLESLKLLDISAVESKVIVVDNASKDGSVSEIKKRFPKVDILQTGQNLGFGGGFNKGLDYGLIWGADYFLVINNDTLIKNPLLLIDLIDTLKSDPKIGLVSPKIYFAPGFEFHKDQYKKQDLGQVIWYAGGYFDWDNIRSVHRGLDEVDSGQYDQIESVDMVSGACFLVKREILEKVGLFDEKYFLYLEDSDFVKRVTDAGFKKYYNGQVAIYHKVSQSTGIGSEITDYYHTRNRLIFGMKYAKIRTKFALMREAIKLLIFGRNAQRRGVLDFYLGITGGSSNEPPTYGNEDLEYPLKLSIGIVNYNTAPLVRKLLKSIFESKSGFDADSMEVIVLDNGSSENCKNEIKEFISKIKYLQNLENEGFAKGYNKTIKYSLGQYYLMLNSDIDLLGDGISELIRVEDKLRDTAVLGGKLFFPELSAQDSAFHLPNILGAFKEYFLMQKGAYFMYQPAGEKPVRVEGLVMACFLIPKKVISLVGLLDEATFLFFEDIEYCRRLRQFGIPIFFVPSAKFIHFHGSSTKKIGQEKAYEHLKKAAEHYHGKIYYRLLSLILRLGQKLGRVQTPVSRWTKN